MVYKNELREIELVTRNELKMKYELERKIE